MKGRYEGMTDSFKYMETEEADREAKVSQRFQERQLRVKQ